MTYAQNAEIDSKGAVHTLWMFVRPYRGHLVLGFSLVLINRFSSLVLPASTKYLIDDVVGKRHTQLLVPLLIIVVAAACVQGISLFALTHLLPKTAQKLITELRCHLQAHLERLPVAVFDDVNTGALVARVMNDVEGVRNLMGTGLVQFLGMLLTSILAGLVLFYISPLMTLLVLSLVSVFGVPLKRAAYRLRPLLRERNAIHASLSGRLTESLAGIRVVKGYAAEKREAETFSRGAYRLLDRTFKALQLQASIGLASAMLLAIVTAAVLFVGTHEVLAGSLTLGSFLTYIVFLGLLVSPIVHLSDMGTQVTEALAGLDRVLEILGERPEDRDPRRTITLTEVRGEVIFDKVSFAYRSDNLVLRDISFHAEPGTLTALVGPSGAGKSTIAGLIAAFYSPTEGTVSVDGIDLSKIRLDSYRARIGVVLQDPFLFDGSILENVAFSRPHANITEVLNACRAAYVNEFAEKCHHGYDTVVGECGVKLSGGQKQRVAIARAIVADARILILDEATSSLDPESENLIQCALVSLMRDRTTFIITHRLSTIRMADQILVIENGRISERGTHDSLLKARGYYCQLYAEQLAPETNVLSRESGLLSPVSNFET